MSIHVLRGVILVSSRRLGISALNLSGGWSLINYIRGSVSNSLVSGGYRLAVSNSFDDFSGGRV